jgi:isopenicillin-N epimerase
MTREAFWALTDSVTFLNHGSFGACPRAVLAQQARLHAELEAEPVRFMKRALEGLIDDAREVVAKFVGAKAANLVPVANATTAVNAVLRSLKFRPGDELLTTSHAYNACRNVLDFVAREAGAKVVVAQVPWPLTGAEQITEAIVSAVSPSTKVALIDHVTSPTGLVWPIEGLVRELEGRGVMVLVDGAHAPGMVPLALEALGASFYTGNLHKWVCAPKSAGFLHVRGDRQALVRPTVLSHGANSPRGDRSRFLLEFDWVGTTDFTPFLCAPTAIEVMGALGGEGGWPALMEQNRAEAVQARAQLEAALEVAPMAPVGLVGSMATVHLPGDCAGLQERLYDAHQIEVPIIAFAGGWQVRVSMQRHVRPGDVGRLIEALKRER